MAEICSNPQEPNGDVENNKVQQFSKEGTASNLTDIVVASTKQTDLNHSFDDDVSDGDGHYGHNGEFLIDHNRLNEVNDHNRDNRSKEIDPNDQSLSASVYTTVNSALISEGNILSTNAVESNISETTQCEESAYEFENHQTEAENAVTKGLLQKEILNGEERNQLFHQALLLFDRNKYDAARRLFLSCIKGLEKGSGFLYVPQCLHRLAEIYHSQSDDEKAIMFLKAEKLYYETALIDSQEAQIGTDGQQLGDGQNVDATRAAEYERLAKLCLDQKQSHLALEFSGKATKLYQSLYGDGHEATQRSLDLFTSIYAEVGRHEYSESFQKYSGQSHAELELAETDVVEPQAATILETEVQTLRQRKHVGEIKPAAVVGLSSSTDVQRTHILQAAWHERIPPYVVGIVLIGCLIICAVLIGYLYCQLTRTSSICHSLRSEYRFYSDRLRYLWFRYHKFIAK